MGPAGGPRTGRRPKELTGCPAGPDSGVMKHAQSRTHRATWGAIVLVMAFLTAVSVTVPRAFAEGTDTDSSDLRHYFQIIESAYQFISQNYVDSVDAKKLYEGMLLGDVRVRVELPWFVTKETVLPADAWPNTLPPTLPDKAYLRSST